MLPLLFLAACSVQAKVELKSTPNDAASVIPVSAPSDGGSCSETSCPWPPPKKHAARKVLIVGDSEACAVSQYIDLRKLVAQINDEDGLPHDHVDVACKGGTVVQYWGAGGNLKIALQKYPHPDAVLVFLGTNHYWQDKAPPTQTVTDQLKDTNCIWVGNTAVHGRYWKINHLIYEAVTPQCSYFDTETADIPLADGVHPTPAGATKWIRAVWPMIPPKYEASDE